MLAVFKRAFGVLSVCLCLVLGTAEPSVALAQSQSAAPVALSRIQLLAEGRDQSVFSLTFSPRVGSYSIVNSDPTKPAVALMRAVRSNGVDTSQGYRGLVRSIEVEQTDTGLAVRFTATAPAKVEAETSGADKLLVTITKLSGAEAIGSKPVGEQEPHTAAHVLPPAYQPLPGEDGFELVMLKYADVSEVVGLLTQGVTVKPNNIFIRREPGFGALSANGNTNYVSPQNQGPEEGQPLGESVDSNLAIDRRLNAIWIKGSPDRIAWIKGQIDKIDVPVDSVILETQFVELTETGARNLGVDFTNASGQLAVGTVTTGGFSPLGADLKDVIPSGSIQAAIYAQIQKGNGRIVSTPRIAAQSGSTAKIITGDALPILTAITLSGVNGVSQQVQYVNVGVTLQIAPRVSTDGYVTSHIYGVVSSVTGYSQGYPTISQREAETSASVRDGETFVIGGLTQDNALNSKSKIPLLGDIPLLGQAFRVDKSTKSKTELYIVITPHIVRHRRFEDIDAAGGAETGVTSYYNGSVPTGSPLQPPQPVSPVSEQPH